jgi:hypothetical protein
MPGYVAGTDVVRIARQRPMWRWTQLEAAIRRDRGCHPSTSQRAIKRAVRAGLVIHYDGAYQVAEDADVVLAVPYCYRRIDRRALLLIMGERRAWPYTDLVEEACIRLDATEPTVARSLRYGRDFGYIRRTGDYRWALTPLCRQLLANWGRLEGAEGFRFATYLSGHPKRGFRRWASHPEHQTPHPGWPPRPLDTSQTRWLPTRDRGERGRG